MDQPSSDAAQQGYLECVLETEHEYRLSQFLDGLRRDRYWSMEKIRAVEAKIREMLGGPGLAFAERAKTSGRGDGLSRRESEVLQLLARGYTGKEIGAHFKLSAKTVETYKARAFEKLGLTGRPDVIRYALEQGWLVHSTAAASDATTDDCQ